jgi:LEA14-like dessication related protein
MNNRSSASQHPFRTLLLILVVLLLALAGYGYYLYRANENAWLKPDLKSVKTSIKEITPDSLKAQVSMTVHNSLPLTIRVDSMGYVMAIQGDTLIQGSQHRPTQVKASSDGQLTIPMNTDLKRLIKKIDQLQRDSADVYLRMVLYNRLPVVGTNRLPVEVQKTIYIPKLPKFEVEKIKIDKLSLKGGRLVVTLQVHNYQALPFTISQFAYHLRLSDNIDVKGKETKDIHFQKKGTETVDFPIDLKLAQMGEAAYKMLFKSKSTPYRMDGTMQVSTKQNFVGNFNMDFNSAGTIDELKEVANDAIAVKKEKKKDKKEADKQEKKEQKEQKKEEKKEQKEKKKQEKQEQKDRERKKENH